MTGTVTQIVSGGEYWIKSTEHCSSMTLTQQLAHSEPFVGMSKRAEQIFKIKKLQASTIYLMA